MNINSYLRSYSVINEYFPIPCLLRESIGKETKKSVDHIAKKGGKTDGFSKFKEHRVFKVRRLTC